MNGEHRRNRLWQRRAWPSRMDDAVIPPLESLVHRGTLQNSGRAVSDDRGSITDCNHKTYINSRLVIEAL